MSQPSVHHLEALVECEPCRPGMPGEHLALLDGGVQAEAERGVPTHLTGEHPTGH